MADKLMRTVVVMSFFLLLALFSGCGANAARRADAGNRKQVAVQSGIETDTVQVLAP